MTAKEYLNQARHLDALINCRLREIDYWRDLSSSVSGSNFEPHYNPNKPTEAPFVRCLEKIDAIQRDVAESTGLPAVRSSWYSVTVTWTTAPGRRYPGC